MPKTVVWVGSRGLNLQPSYPQWEFTSSGGKLTLVYEGPYESCLTGKPAINTAIKDYPPNMLVSNVRVQHGEGGRGVLTIACETVDNGDNNDNNQSDTQFELEWVAVDKPLSQHKKFKELPDKEIQKVRLWMDCDDLELTQNYKFSYKDKDGVTHSDGSLNDSTIKYAKRIKRGQDSYRVYAPVVRATTQVSTPSSGGAGQKATPPFGPGGFEYIKTADRCNRTGASGKWTRTQEWTGFDEIDEYILQ